jgi:hypothetical protein
MGVWVQLKNAEEGCGVFGSGTRGRVHAPDSDTGAQYFRAQIESAASNPRALRKGIGTPCLVKIRTVVAPETVPTRSRPAQRVLPGSVAPRRARRMASEPQIHEVEGVVVAREMRRPASYSTSKARGIMRSL